MKRNEYLINHWNRLTQDLSSLKHNHLQLLLSLYQSPTRHYHNVHHLETLFHLFDQYHHVLASPMTVQFAIWYHDAIYQATQTDNEEKSAQLAKAHLTTLHLPPTLIDSCCQYILATKHHQLPQAWNTIDEQFMLDIDLAILGAEPEHYQAYSEQIRREYHMYSDQVYKEGRKKVLGQLLELQPIYRTNFMSERFEEQARRNLYAELKDLSAKDSKASS